MEQTPTLEQDVTDAARPGPVGRWMVALRLFAFGASLVPVCLGLVLSYSGGHLVKWLPFALTLAGVFCFHSAGNLLNDYWDYRAGLDTSPDAGSGALVRGLLSQKSILAAGLTFLALGALFGLYLFYAAGWPVLVLGAAGAFLTIGYTAPGLRLKYVALGDLAIFLSFGPLVVLGTYLVQAGQVAAAPLLWSLPVASLTVGILHANNWGDIGGDLRKGCRTLAGLLGHRWSAVYYRWLILFPYIALPVLVGASRWTPLLPPAPLTVFAPFLTLPLARRLLRRTKGGHEAGDTRDLRPLDVQTARLQMAFGLLLTAGFLLGPP